MDFGHAYSQIVCLHGFLSLEAVQTEMEQAEALLRQVLSHHEPNQSPLDFPLPFVQSTGTDSAQTQAGVTARVLESLQMEKSNEILVALPNIFEFPLNINAISTTRDVA